jgi:hypothetical protein
MSDQKITEFWERALDAVTPADPDQLLQRGRALRRRRQLGSVVAVAATAAAAFGLSTGRGDDQSEPLPATRVTQSPTSGPPLLGNGLTESHTYGIDTLRPDSRADLLVDRVGGSRDGWTGAWWAGRPALGSRSRLLTIADRIGVWSASVQVSGGVALFCGCPPETF